MIKEIETHTRSDRCCCHESLMAQNIYPMLTQCWSTVRDAMLAYRLMNQDKVNSCLYIWSIPTKVMHIGKKTTLLHSPEFFSLYRRHMELSQKIYASS